MVISKLSLQNFRNFSSLAIDFFKEITLIVGDNGAGKSNILEAIYFLAIGGSFRTEADKEAIFWGEELARIKAKIEGISLEVILTSGLVQGQKTPSKKFLVNNISRRMTDFTGNLRVVLFTPQDLELVYGEPFRRRKYLDSVLKQTDRQYARILISYQKALYQRNRLLEQINEGRAQRDSLDFWDGKLLEWGAFLFQKRQDFINFLNFRKESQDNLEWIYKPSVINEQKIKDNRERDISAGLTLSGPHRDDFSFDFFGRDLCCFGSRGQQRRAVLALKLGELGYLKEICQKEPLLLLDDIFSELDQDGRRRVLEIIPKQQTIITTTDLHFIEGNKLKDFAVLKLEDGKIG